MKANTDGSSRGNHGLAGWGVIFRDNNGVVHGTLIGGLGVCTCYVAECKAIVECITKAIELGWTRLWIQTDSSSAAAAFNTNKVHWQCKAAWEQARHKMEWLLTSSTWRETNFSADSCARKGASLPKGVKQWWNSRADFILRIEDPNTTYFRFGS
ncbi:hypothetical protein IFM89_002021 [Coptis chinensis]|uniref:RNase H type-1 domain-containing protein n=1 Tax=Coptis chinensis TaxID=261450 RepID=A0A835HHX1_9MAGN|nr:hypothetical protein IFM89_002021 [Coptis chinensis]